ncbi:uncharacterized protein LOC142906541 isoform X3 [Petromyzon marinus]|uniref:uncharacterized protein LOC142906541 isoform X3 n=1 Tax=Petromyzon marinus TaxID=7757 RepID=UPI003F6EF151
MMASWIDFAPIKQECEDNTSLGTWPDLVMKSADIDGAQLPKNVKIDGGSERREEMADSRACVATSDQDYVKVELEKYAARAELLKNVKIEGASERPEEMEDSHGFLPTAGRNFIKVELDEEDLGKGPDFNHFKFEGGANERPAVTGSSRGCPATADQNFVEVELDEEDVGEGLDFNQFTFEGGANERPAVTGSSHWCPATADQNFVEVELDEEDVGEGETTPADLLCTECGDGDGRPIRTKLTEMATRLTLEQRRKVAAWMDVFHSPTVVRNKYREHFNCNPPSRLTIYRVYKKFVETGSVDDNYKGNSGRPRTGRSPANIAVTQEAFLRSPGKSNRRFSVECGLPRATVWRILNKDLGMRPYHLQTVQALSPANKVARVEACKIFLEMKNLEPDIHRLVAFSDEATFHISGHVNKHNCVFWGTENPRVVREHELDSPKVNVWCAVTGTGVVGPYFFENTTINGGDFLHMMENYAEDNLPLQIRLTGYFQLDSAAPHFASNVRAHLNRKFERRWIGRGGPVNWPAHSPDLTPCDFWLWGMVMERVYATKPRDVRDLRQKIENVIATIPQEMCLRALETTWRRFQACVDNDGDQVETL